MSLSLKDLLSAASLFPLTDGAPKQQSSWYPGLFLGGGVSGVYGCGRAKGVSETGNFTSNKLGMEGRILSLRKGWVNSLILHDGGAKGHFLCTNFLDFLSRMHTPSKDAG